MKLRHTRQEAPDISLTPLIDVVFLLLIFFMVSTTFDKEAELSIELPEATTEAEKRENRQIDIAIDASGRFYVNGRQLVNQQTQTLKQAMRKASGGETSIPVIISADAKTPHQSVVAVMDAARQLGLVRLTFAARLSNADN
ncbi:MAG: biopolymer transporter ExbD [Gammaproteobacteria bacterium]|nr:biopolymer transporter ExbD [Gammaproteobacteria bacterium]